VTNSNRNLTMFCMSQTPFQADGSLDEDGLRAHLQRLVTAGNGIYLGSGGAGEGHVLSVKESRRVYEIGVEEAKGKVPLYANPRESRTAEGMLEVANEAAAAGIDCVQFYQLDAGHGMIPTPKEQELYWHTLLDAVKIPVAISIHAYAGFMAPPDFLAGLCEQYPQIIAVNVMNSDVSYFMKLRDTLPERISLYGSYVILMQVASLGAAGCLMAENNVIPNITQAIADSWRDGDLDKVAENAKNLQRFATIVSAWAPSTARWVKMALKVLDLGNGVLRPPYLLPSEDDQRRMLAAFDALGVRELEGLPSA
jgi:4-hydroxy-tetrahydrodipicolinate synthase